MQYKDLTPEQKAKLRAASRAWARKNNPARQLRAQKIAEQAFSAVQGTERLQEVYK